MDREGRAGQKHRRAIIDSVKSGEISREDARQQLQQLSEASREAIRNNPDNEPIIQAMCECKLTHFENVRAILDEAQQATWDEWVASLEGPCFSDGT